MMNALAVSTHWIAYRHADGSAMADEINSAGFQSVELGYDTRPELVPGIRAALADGRITCDSVHNTCPVPDGFAKGHPEWFLLASTDATERQAAIHHTLQTARFAASIGARIVVCHAGNVQMPRFTAKLARLYTRGKKETPRYDRLRAKASAARQAAARPHFSALCQALDELLPGMEQCGIVLAFENLPSLEAMPTAEEQAELFARFPSPCLQYWHDFGHGQILQNLGIAPNLSRLRRFADRTAGVHIHDTNDASDSHTMPPLPGGVAWAPATALLQPDWTLVLEPATATPSELVQHAHQFIQQNLLSALANGKSVRTG